jgi:hypothetical protein
LTLIAAPLAADELSDDLAARRAKAMARLGADAMLVLRMRDRDPAQEHHLDIGVRVDDSFLLEEAGPRRLTGSVPRTIDDIEAFMRRRTVPAGAR